MQVTYIITFMNREKVVFKNVSCSVICIDKDVIFVVNLFWNYFIIHTFTSKKLMEYVQTARRNESHIKLSNYIKDLLRFWPNYSVLEKQWENTL